MPKERPVSAGSIRHGPAALPIGDRSTGRTLGFGPGNEGSSPSPRTRMTYKPLVAAAVAVLSVLVAASAASAHPVHIEESVGVPSPLELPDPSRVRGAHVAQDGTTAVAVSASGSSPASLLVRSPDTDDYISVDLTVPPGMRLTSLRGVWSDGDAIWAVDWVSARMMVFGASDGWRMDHMGFGLHEDNWSPEGIWSDGTTLWVADSAHRRVFAYDKATGVHDESVGFSLTSKNTSPAGMWGHDGVLWVSDDVSGTLHAYRVSDGDHDKALSHTMSPPQYPAVAVGTSEGWLSASAVLDLLVADEPFESPIEDESGLSNGNSLSDATEPGPGPDEDDGKMVDHLKWQFWIGERDEAVLEWKPLRRAGLDSTVAVQYRLEDQSWDDAVQSPPVGLQERTALVSGLSPWSVYEMRLVPASGPSHLLPSESVKALPGNPHQTMARLVRGTVDRYSDDHSWLDYALGVLTVDGAAILGHWPDAPEWVDFQKPPKTSHRGYFRYSCTVDGLYGLPSAALSCRSSELYVGQVSSTLLEQVVIHELAHAASITTALPGEDPGPRTAMAVLTLYFGHMTGFDPDCPPHELLADAAQVVITGRTEVTGYWSSCDLVLDTPPDGVLEIVEDAMAGGIPTWLYDEFAGGEEDLEAVDTAALWDAVEKLYESLEEAESATIIWSVVDSLHPLFGGYCDGVGPVDLVRELEGAAVGHFLDYVTGPWKSGGCHL